MSTTETKSKIDDTHVLLVGNGINEDKLSWSDLLEKIGEKEHLDCSDLNFKNKNANFLLLFEYLSLKSLNGANKTALEICKKQNSKNKDYIKRIWNIYDIILTTNFDDSLSVTKKDLFSNLSKKRKSNLCRRLEFQYNNKKKKLFYSRGSK